MLGVLNAFLPYDIFNFQWVYWDVTPLLVKEDLYCKEQSVCKGMADSISGLSARRTCVGVQWALQLSKSYQWLKRSCVFQYTWVVLRHLLLPHLSLRAWVHLPSPPSTTLAEVRISWNQTCLVEKQEPLFCTGEQFSWFWPDLWGLRLKKQISGGHS